MKKRGLFYIVLVSIILSMLIIQTSNFVRALEIDETIVNKLKNQTEVPVIIMLRDNSNISYLPTISKQERFNILQNKKQHFKDIQNDVLSTLSVSDLKIKYIYSTIPSIAGNITKSGFNKLKNNSDVLNIYPDRIGTYSLQQSVPLINATKVWELQINGKNITGIGQTICVIDSGVDYTHPDLGGCNQTQFLSGNCSKVISGYDFESNNNDPMDANGHGTHVIGIVVANGSINGIAPGAKIVALKVGTYAPVESAVTAAVDWCYDNSTKFNISVMTMSLGLGSYSCDSDCYNDTALSQVINEAYEYGIFIDDASGNEGYTNQINYPACIKGVTSVGATYDINVGYRDWWPTCIDSATYADKLVCFTNRCEILDLLAPGAIINSTILGGGYEEMSGTSMAAPHVAGAAALLFQINNSLTPDEIKDILNQTGVRISDSVTGLNFSRIDVYNAVKKAISYPKINQIQCHNSTTWTDCSNILYGSTLTQVRTNCTSPYGYIKNVTFKLENIPDNSIFFNNNATSNESDWWYYNNDDIIINDSGEFNLTVTCFDNENLKVIDYENWTVPWGKLSPYLIDPISNKNVSQNKFFSFSSGVKCVDGECGNISASVSIYDIISIIPITPRRCDNTWEQSNINCTDLTMDNCKATSCDGNDVVEWIRVNRTYFRPGESINATIYVRCFNSSDRISISYNNGNGWINKFCQQCNGSGYYTYSKSFNLSENLGEHWVRGSVGYNTACNFTCADGTYSDNDDVNFSVKMGISIPNSSTSFYITDPRTCDDTWGFDCGGGPPESEDNTFNNCNSSAGNDESVENIYINATSVAPGDIINVTCEFQPSIYPAYWPSDHDYIWYFNGSGWRRIHNGTPQSSSAYNVSVNITVDNVIGTHWVRCSIIYGTDSDECSNESYGGYYYWDNDDVNFIVNSRVPFYTTSSNPKYPKDLACLANMHAGDSCNQTWQVNATGEINSTWQLFTLYSPITYLNVVSNITGRINITILNITILPNDTSKFYIKNNTGSTVAWLGNEGNIVLKGTCHVSNNCVESSENLFIIGNSTTSVVSYINSTGDLCIEKGECSVSASCNPTKGAFKIRNSSGSIVSYIDFDGKLCFIGGLYESSNL